jgi:hypothetical protein
VGNAMFPIARYTSAGMPPVNLGPTTIWIVGRPRNKNTAILGKTNALNPSCLTNLADDFKICGIKMRVQTDVISEFLK